MTMIEDDCSIASNKIDHHESLYKSDVTSEILQLAQPKVSAGQNPTHCYQFVVIVRFHVKTAMCVYICIYYGVYNYYTVLSHY